jgi:flagellar basal body rod protein FlgG
MNYGLHLSAAGVLSNLYRQDLYANNLANIETIGFKPDSVTIRQRPPERIEGAHAFTEPQWLLERLGGGLLVNPTNVSLAQGNLNATEAPLDLAIEGEGLFVVGRPGETDPTELRLTRDGRFSRNQTGELTMASTGMTVLDDRGRSLVLDANGQITVGSDGTVTQNDATIGRLRLVAVDSENLTKAGTNLLRLRDGVSANAALRDPTGTIRQGFIEASAVDPIKTLTKLIGATKTSQANAKLMQYHDFIMGQTIGTFGRVA